MKNQLSKEKLISDETQGPEKIKDYMSINKINMRIKDENIHLSKKVVQLLNTEVNLLLQANSGYTDKNSF